MIASLRLPLLVVVLLGLATSPATGQKRRPDLPPDFVDQVRHKPDGKTARMQVKVGEHGKSRYFPDSLRDGPHVFWDGSVARAQYACFGQLPEQAVEGGAFTGFCGDETRRYRVEGEFAAPPAFHDAADRVFVVSGVHGYIDALAGLLAAAGITDGDGGWQWGGGHLVVLGNTVNKGPQVTRTLWYLKDLEEQARAAGGNVHLLLGPHEAGLLSGNPRYAHWKYGEYGFPQLLDLAYPDLYGFDTELGRWLRSRNAIIRIGRTVLAHGGLNPNRTWSNAEIEAVNETVRDALSLPVEDRDEALSGALTDPSESPLRYRGYHVSESVAPPREQVEAMLSSIEADRVVVSGMSAEARSLLNGRAYATAAEMDDASVVEGLLIQNGLVTRVSADGQWIAVD